MRGSKFDGLICNRVQVVTHDGRVFIETGLAGGALQSILPLDPDEAEVVVTALQGAVAALRRSRGARAVTRAPLKPSRRVRSGFGHGPP